MMACVTHHICDCQKAKMELLEEQIKQLEKKTVYLKHNLDTLNESLNSHTYGARAETRAQQYERFLGWAKEVEHQGPEKIANLLMGVYREGVSELEKAMDDLFGPYYDRH